VTSDGTAESGFSHGGRWRHCWNADRGGSGEKILCQCRLVATLNSLTYNVLWVMKRKALPRSLWPVPLCHVNLDARQKQIEEEFKESFNLPIIYFTYFTQLMGLALGLKSEALGLDKHFVDPNPLLHQVL